MNLKDIIKQNRIKYFKERNEVLKQAYESVLARIMNEEKSGKYTGELSDEVVQNLIIKEIKELKDAITYYKPEEDKYTELELRIKELEQYLPNELTEEEVIKIINDVKATGETNKGKIIGFVVKQVGNRFDKSKIAKMV